MKKPAKPIRRVTTEWLGGPHRHWCADMKTYKDISRNRARMASREIERKKREQLVDAVFAYLQHNDEKTSVEIAEAIDSNAVAVTRALRVLGSKVFSFEVPRASGGAVRPAPRWSVRHLVAHT